MVHFKDCKTVSHFLQIHSKFLTSFGASYFPTSHHLHGLLHFISASPATIKLCSASITQYAISLFSTIRLPTAFSFNNIFRLHTIFPAPLHAINLFVRMRRLSITPDSYSFPILIKATSLNPHSIPPFHSLVIRFGFLHDLFVVNNLIRAYSLCGSITCAKMLFIESPARDLVSFNTMIDGLVKAGEVVLARKLFDTMPERDSISWATLISGYSQMNLCEEGIALFDAMLGSNVNPQNTSIVTALSCCARLGKTEKGKEIHSLIEKSNVKLDSFISTALIDFYSKSGLIEKALEIFESCSDKGLFTWNSLLISLATHGLPNLLLNYFKRMAISPIKPDGVTLLAVLVGCSHGGLPNEGIRIFKEMETLYSVPMEAKHLGCMADLLGRRGMVEEAMKIMKETNVSDVYVWGSLLGGCRSHGNVGMAESAAKMVKEVEPGDGGVYSMLASVYASVARWEDVGKIRNLLSSDRKVDKMCGYSFITVEGAVHQFVSWDELHPRKDHIFSALHGLKMHQLEIS